MSEEINREHIKRIDKTIKSIIEGLADLTSKLKLLEWASKQKKGTESE